MRARVVALTIAVCAGVLLAVPQPIASVEPRETAAQIDFDALHGQAADALQLLQQAHERRLASIEVESF